MKSTPSFTAAAVTFTAATVTAVAVTAFTVTASAALDHARAEIERMARAAGTAEGARGWWHAVRIVRLFGSAARASRQCARHARFFSASAPEKAAAYRGAMVILARHTGESLADFKAGPAPKKKTKKGPGWIGGMGWEMPGATKTTTSSPLHSSHPSCPSRSLIHRRDPSPSASIPFICG